MKKDVVIVEIALDTPLDDAQTRALQTAADRHGAFLGLPAFLERASRAGGRR